MIYSYDRHIKITLLYDIPELICKQQPMLLEQHYYTNEGKNSNATYIIVRSHVPYKMS